MLSRFFILVCASLCITGSNPLSSETFLTKVLNTLKVLIHTRRLCFFTTVVQQLLEVILQYHFYLTILYTHCLQITSLWCIFNSDFLHTCEMLTPLPYVKYTNLSSLDHFQLVVVRADILREFLKVRFKSPIHKSVSLAENVRNCGGICISLIYETWS